ncbi:hypothetical protein CBR_g31793 [Chara braunii]|uniref:CCHC-type domain-containing protein n=1 Tax=Chara braunii TaxID=69332 RepID=A0A388LFT1_CHABU|nr:hypothetical protein CBR_g31793 [Chara braunii]|eukprot:GBG81117.1 hypothetical protein CBR_g31793 [Chara braunii]
MRNMRPIAVRAPMQGGMAAAQAAAGPGGTAANACFTCHQPGHLARDCPHRAMQPRVGAAPAAAAPIANGPRRVGAMMDDQGGSNGMMISSEEVAELIPLEQFVSLGYPGLGMIGTIRPELESREVAEWRPSSSEVETGGHTFVTGEIDVLEVTRALDHRIPLPIGHLLSISEQANERMMQHCKANRKRFAIARAKDQKAKAPAPEEKAVVASDPIRVGLIQNDDHFLRIKLIPWKSAECDIEVWGVPYSAIIDSGAAVLAISLRVVERAGRKSDLIMLTEKDQRVSADEEKIKTVGRMTNVAFRLGKVHALGDVVVLHVNTSIRICIDYRKLNDITIKDVYPLPRIDDLLDAIGCANYFSKFDIRHGFHHILVKEEDRPKTAFVLFEGTWQWVRCPMGICNAHATFQRAMNVTFQNFVNKTRLTQGMINFCVIVYMDDILVYSDTFHGHVQHIEWTLGALRDAGFKIALEKSEFFLPEISFLGYIVTRGGQRPDSRKVAAVKEAPVPTSLVQSDLHPRLSFCINPLAVPLLDPSQWDAWRGDFIEHSLCLTEVRVTWTRDENNYLRSERLELLLIQAWRTEVEGDLLGFLFGAVRPGCRRLLTQELTIMIAQLADDLDVSITSQDDARLVPHITSRTLLPYLQWSACVEGFPSRIPPSRLDYLDPRDILDPAFYRPPYENELDEIVREELAEESSEEEEDQNEGEGEPAEQGESEEDEENEGEEGTGEESSEQGSGDESTTTTAPAGDCAGADRKISNDPTIDPEPP